MAAQQIARADQGLSRGARGIGARAHGLVREGKSRNLRRNGFVRVQFPRLSQAREGWRMSPAGPRHIPVLGREAVEMLGPRAGGTYVDATFGGGGYSRAILGVGGTQVIGIDRDRTAIAGGFGVGDPSGGRLTLVGGG